LLDYSNQSFLVDLADKRRKRSQASRGEEETERRKRSQGTKKKKMKKKKKCRNRLSATKFPSAKIGKII
jgi:hypothetical protein